MLSVWILNAGKGDSIVLHHVGKDGPTFGVIDSNIHGGTPPALRKLKELGAEKLSFVALTHPHVDHYAGLPEVMDAYEGAIDHFYTYPVGNENSTRFKKLFDICEELHQSTDGKVAKRQIREFLRVLECGVRIGLDNWVEVTGEQTRLFPTGFSDLEFWGILPPARVKGNYFQAINAGDLSVLDQGQDLNRLSVAFMVIYKGIELILGGDGTYENWMIQRHAWSHANKTSEAMVVKLPHHGSKKDCAPEVIDHMFSDTGNRVAAISANGRTHPHDETYAILEERNIKPYCTNLASQCGANVHTMLSIPNLDPVARRYLNTYVHPVAHAIQPCQGDIEIMIDDSAKLTVTPQFNHACPYRVPSLFD